MKKNKDSYNISDFIHLDIAREAFHIFSEILQKGFYYKTKCIGNNLETLLKSELGLTNEYISKKIGTIFLDGKPIDNLKSAILRHHSKIALSAAMPGLVGAIMRQGSPFAAMREGISHKSLQKFDLSEEGLVIIKLFNLVIYDIGEEILKKGVILCRKELLDFLMSKSVLNKCSRILLNFREINSEILLKDIKNDPADLFVLTVSFLDAY